MCALICTISSVYRQIDLASLWWWWWYWFLVLIGGQVNIESLWIERLSLSLLFPIYFDCDSKWKIAVFPIHSEAVDAPFLFRLLVLIDMSIHNKELQQRAKSDELFLCNGTKNLPRICNGLICKNLLKLLNGLEHKLKIPKSTELEIHAKLAHIHLFGTLYHRILASARFVRSFVTDKRVQMYSTDMMNEFF